MLCYSLCSTIYLVHEYTYIVAMSPLSPVHSCPRCRLYIHVPVVACTFMSPLLPVHSCSHCCLYIHVPMYIAIATAHISCHNYRVLINQHNYSFTYSCAIYNKDNDTGTIIQIICIATHVSGHVGQTTLLTKLIYSVHKGIKRLVMVPSLGVEMAKT